MAHRDAGTPRLTHVDERGQARMVDVGEKAVTHRIAVASGFVSMEPSTLKMIVGERAPKGDVLAVARVAGIMAAKRTAELVPMCHPLAITHAAVELRPVGPDSAAGTDAAGDGNDTGAPARCGIEIEATVSTDGKTGVEMEALTAAAIAGLTIYDMCKAVDRGMVIGEVAVLSKEGGKSGTWTRKEPLR